MRAVIIACAVFLVILALNAARADWAYDEIREGLKKGLSYDGLRQLENKYKRKIIDGEGYVLLIQPSELVNGRDVHIVDKYGKDETRFLGDVCVVIAEGNPSTRLVKELQKGDKVRFSGSVDYFFAKTIFLRGSTKIER